MEHSIWSRDLDGPPERVVRGASPALGRARVGASGDRMEWTLDGAQFSPDAGTGVAALIADWVLHGDEAKLSAAARHANERERAIPVDQTHVSVIVDDRFVVKIVRVWGGADRSAAILERLRVAGSHVAPEFYGTLSWEHPERGSTVLGLVSAYVPEAEDGWSWAVADAVAHVARGADEPEWPADLGRLTASMHADLTLPDEAPHGPRDPRSGDRERAAEALDRVFGAFDPNDEFGNRMLGRRRAFDAAIDLIPADSSAPLLMPHGDYHVGQILRTAGGRYLVLDFDGDPQWERAQRFQLDGAARDVAHMLVSIDLVAAVVQRRMGGSDERAWRWGARAQQQFLDAYLAASAPGMLDENALEGLIAEQLIAEVAYAQRFRPEWRYAPDGVISRRYPRSTTTPGTPESMEHPWSPPALPTT